MLTILTCAGPHGDRVMRMRFWFGITRGDEKWVKLALGHFLNATEASRPRVFQTKARSHHPITVLSGLLNCTDDSEGTALATRLIEQSGGFQNQLLLFGICYGCAVVQRTC